MNCPVCKNTKLVISERQGIEIDYCPDCRGIWLDRGELDKLIEKSVNSKPAAPAENDRNYDESRNKNDKYYYKDDRDYDYKKKKKESFLGDLFDF
ncbi:MAG: zf-TFIIB domain-containing protein [Ignavibacteriaceae bacterium]|nr:zf-TFIIB domain-containing protein [Ignavibacteriaceae bacterium]